MLCFLHVIYFLTTLISLSNHVDGHQDDFISKLKEAHANEYTFSNDIWHNYLFDTGVNNREELIVNHVKSVDDFTHGHDVTEWQSVNLRNVSYIFGMTSKSIKILTAVLNRDTTGFLVAESTFDINVNITAFTVFQTWSKERMTNEIILIVAISDSTNFDMLWYRLGADNKLEDIWIWHLHKKVAHLRAFMIDKQNKLLIINEEHSHYAHTTADIYDFNLHKKEPEFWLFQSLPLDSSAISSAINEDGPFTYLTIPQVSTNAANIYVFSGSRFIPYQNITSKNVEHVSSFHIGPRSFLAIGGRQASVYKFTKSGLRREITDIQLQQIKNFLPIPVKNYRQDVLLLAQYDLHHETHVSNMVRIFLYANGVFNVHDEVPCQVFGVESHGATCMVDDEWDRGIIGATVISLGNLLGLLVPSHQMHAAFFMVDTTLVEVEHPFVTYMKSIDAEKNRIQHMLAEQEEKILKTQEIMKAGHAYPENESILREPLKVSLFPAESRMLPIREIPLENNNVSSQEMNNNLTEISKQIDDMKQKIVHIKTDLVKNKTIENLIIDGTLQVTGTSNVNDIRLRTLNDENFDEMIGDCVRRSQGPTHVIIGEKVFVNGTPENVKFTTLNNMDATKIAYIADGPIQVSGNVHFENGLTVLNDVILSPNGKVNDIDLQEEIIDVNSNKSYENLHFENVKAAHVNMKAVNNEDITHLIDMRFGQQRTIPDDVNIENATNEGYLQMPHTSLTVENINGVPFDEFVQKLIFKDDLNKLVLPGTTTIDGDLFITGNAEIDTLNDLVYPRDYLMNHPGDSKDQFTAITGKKTFTGNVSAVEVTVEETIDGVNPETVIVLNLEQKLPGEFTFEDLEITERIRVNGSILGVSGVRRLLNPTLVDTTHLTSNINFKSLEVTGTIHIKNDLNEGTIKPIFKDIVYKTDENMILNELKEIKSIEVANNLLIESKEINGQSLDTFLTKDKIEQLSFEILRGNITIENIDAHGFLDNMNMTEELQAIVKLDEDTFVSGLLLFNNSDNFVDIYANILNIGSLNEPKVSVPENAEQDLIYHTDMFFKNIKIDELVIDGSFQGAIDDFDIDHYDNFRLSISKDQEITGSYNVENLYANHIDTKMVNGFGYEFIKEFADIDKLMIESFQNGQINVEDVYVDGALHINHLNGHNMDELLSNVFWLDRENKIASEIMFQGPVEFDDLTIKNLNGMDLDFLYQDIVKKEEMDVSFTGDKSFEQGFETGSLLTRSINNNDVNDLLVKTIDQEIYPEVIVNGNVWIENQLTTNRINGVPLSYLQNTFQSTENLYVINGDVELGNEVSIDYLYVNGLINKMDYRQYFENLIEKTSPAINGNVTFKNKVIIKKNLHVQSTINGYDFDQIVNDMVLTMVDSTIKVPVVFTQDVVADFIEAHNLNAEYVKACRLEDWRENAVYFDNGRIPGYLTFESISLPENSKFIVDAINEIPISELILLNQDRTIPGTLVFQSITVENDITVGNLVNGLDLPTEFYNTVLKDTNQVIESPVIFTNPLTVSEMKVSGLVNGKNLSKLVTTSSDQTLYAFYNFEGKTTMDSDLHVLGAVNNLNLTIWNDRKITTSGPPNQVIPNPMVVHGNLTFDLDVFGEGLLGDWNINVIADVLTEKMNRKLALESELRAGYLDMCNRLLGYIRKANTQIFKFKYLEFHQDLHLSHEIRTLHTFKFEKRNFLIVSATQSCTSKIYEWVSDKYHFRYEAYTGDVQEYVIVYQNFDKYNQVYIVTRNNEFNHCEQNGVHIWKFYEQELQHIKNLEYSDQIQESKLPSTFYLMGLGAVVEYKIFHDGPHTLVHPYRQWTVHSNNYTFNPHERSLGLSLRNSNKILRLSRKEGRGVEPRYGVETIEGSYQEYSNQYLPAKEDGEMLVIEVGFKESRRKLVAVARHEKTSVKGFLDFIKIYEDISSGILFHKVPTYKPSSLTALEFKETGETLLAFLEDQKTLQLYEYKGMGGFEKRSSIKINASQMKSVSLPLEYFVRERKFLLLVNGNELKILQAVMDGDRTDIKWNCDV